MPCFFCVAIVTTIGGAVLSTTLDRIESALRSVASGEVSRTVDSDSIAVLALLVDAEADGTGGVPAGTAVPVEVSVHKQAGRARITVRTHEVTAAQAGAIQDRVAAAAGLEVVERSGRPLQELPDAPKSLVRWCERTGWPLEQRVGVPADPRVVRGMPTSREGRSLPGTTWQPSGTGTGIAIVGTALFAVLFFAWVTAIFLGAAR